LVFPASRHRTGLSVTPAAEKIGVAPAPELPQAEQTGAPLVAAVEEQIDAPVAPTAEPAAVELDAPAAGSAVNMTAAADQTAAKVAQPARHLNGLRTNDFPARVAHDLR
jgi:hypothetical protein